MQGSGGIELRNRGALHFSRRGTAACHVALSFEFEVPGLLAPFAAQLAPFGNSVLDGDMKRFRAYAEQYHAALQRKGLGEEDVQEMRRA